VSKDPYIKIWCKDFLGDADLALLSEEQVGSLVKIWCAMRQHHPPGIMVNHDGPIDDKVVIKAARLPFDRGVQILRELEQLHILARTKGGALMCRRLVRESRHEGNGAERTRKWRAKKQAVESVTSDGNCDTRPYHTILNQRPPPPSWGVGDVYLEGVYTPRDGCDVTVTASRDGESEGEVTVDKTVRDGAIPQATDVQREVRDLNLPKGARIRVVKPVGPPLFTPDFKSECAGLTAAEIAEKYRQKGWEAEVTIFEESAD
jgi:hypothetical protein